MKVNWAERLMVNSPVRVMTQRLIVKWIGRSLAPDPEAQVLEIGCGRGVGACLILEKFRPALLHALDLDWRMIRRALAYLNPEQRRRISLYVGDAYHLPYRGRHAGRGLRLRGAAPPAGLAGRPAGDRPGPETRGLLFPGGVLSPVLPELSGQADLPAPGARPLLQPRPPPVPGGVRPLPAPLPGAETIGHLGRW